MSNNRKRKRSVSRREFIQTSAAGLAGSLVCGPEPLIGASVAQQQANSNIFHSVNGTPAQNVAKVFEMAYGGIENFIGPGDIVLLRPNLQWSRNGYTNSDIGMAVIDQILRRPGGFNGEIIVIENQQRIDPHTSNHSGWCTNDKASNGPYNWFELVQHFVDNAESYPNGIHTDPTTGQINVSFQFLMDRFAFALDDPHPILTTYGGNSYAGANELFDGSVDPFLRFKNSYPAATCFYVRRSDIRYSNAIARVSPLKTEYEMGYPIFKSQHSGLYISLYKDHPTAWDPNTESFTSRPVKLINMATLNHHGIYAGVTSIVKGHFGIVYRTFHYTGWFDANPPTFYYAGGAVGYWMDTIRRADLHMSCAERIGLRYRTETNAFQAKAVAISTDAVALDYYVGKYILFPAGEKHGEGGSEAELATSNDPSLPGGYYGLTLEYCHDPLADHSIINGTLDESEMTVQRHDFLALPGDFNRDGAVDLTDYQRFHSCANGPEQPPSGSSCEGVDMDYDTDVDLSDFNTFLDSFGGASPP